MPNSKEGLNKGQIARAFQEALRSTGPSGARALDFEQFCVAVKKAIRYCVYGYPLHAGGPRRSVGWRRKTPKLYGVNEEAANDGAPEKARRMEVMQTSSGTRGILKGGVSMGKPGEGKEEKEGKHGGKYEREQLSTAAAAVPPLNLR